MRKSYWRRRKEYRKNAAFTPREKERTAFSVAGAAFFREKTRAVCSAMVTAILGSR